ncbi:MAG: hypothetical protein PHF84_05910, partial [bacterium]|nr:hypothetical protein [bacterium]
MTRKISIYILILLLPLSLMADINRGDFQLEDFNGEYFIPVQYRSIYPDFQKQHDRIYLYLKECSYARKKVDHDLSLAGRTPSSIRQLEQEAGKSIQKDFNDAEWAREKLPFVVNRYPDRYMDGVYYRIKVFIPENYSKNILKLVFLGANYITDVWVNGKWAGVHEGGFTSFAFGISSCARFGKENFIFIRLDNVPWLTDSAPDANKHTIVPYKQM